MHFCTRLTALKKFTFYTIFELELILVTAGFRAEKDRSSMYNELNNSRSAIDQLGRDKVRRKKSYNVFISYMSDF